MADPAAIEVGEEPGDIGNSGEEVGPDFGVELEEGKVGEGWGGGKFLRGGTEEGNQKGELLEEGVMAMDWGERRGER